MILLNLKIKNRLIKCNTDFRFKYFIEDFAIRYCIVYTTIYNIRVFLFKKTITIEVWYFDTVNTTCYQCDGVS